jgi:methyl-accepting chemotaxis protein
MIRAEHDTLISEPGKMSESSEMYNQQRREVMKKAILSCLGVLFVAAILMSGCSKSEEKKAEAPSMKESIEQKATAVGEKAAEMTKEAEVKVEEAAEMTKEAGAKVEEAAEMAKEAGAKVEQAAEMTKEAGAKVEQAAEITAEKTAILKEQAVEAATAEAKAAAETAIPGVKPVAAPK